MTITEFEALGLGAYSHAKVLSAGPHAGCFAHLARMMFTVGIMISTEDGPVTRWCYPSFVPAKAALEQWDGVGDPPGEWIKQKPQNRSRDEIACPA